MKVELDIEILIGILLILVGLMMGGIVYYHYTSDQCVKDPVAYAKNHSNDYNYVDVIPIYNDFRLQ
jgi:hypothetical protein